MRSEVDIDIGTLSDAQSFFLHPLIRDRAVKRIIGLIFNGLSPEDKKKFRDYCDEQDPTKGGGE